VHLLNREARLTETGRMDRTPSNSATGNEQQQHQATLVWTSKTGKNMRIAIANHQNDASYIRHARIETLKAVCVDPHPSLVDPVPVAKYVFAYDERTGQPIGMSESAMLSDVYDSYDDAPYASVSDLNAYCPLGQMASMRTVFVETEYRTSSPLFLALTLGSALLFHRFGARFATATTRGADQYLNRLYEKWGGDRVGTYDMDLTNEPTSLFVFDLEKTLRHRTMRRVSRYVTFELGDEQVVASDGLCA
jgi:hypothetical protein